MKGLAARQAQEQSGDPEAGRAVLEDIRAVLRRILLLAAQQPGDKLLAAAALRATEAAEAAEKLVARQVAVEQIAADYFARGRADMVAEIDRRRGRRLRPVV